jgi:heavy metal efflux system protein
MVSYFNELRREGLSVELAVVRGAVLRLRPVLITASVAALGLIPMLFSTGPGSEIQKPVAAVVIGGLIKFDIPYPFHFANALSRLRTHDASGIISAAGAAAHHRNLRTYNMNYDDADYLHVSDAT